MLALIYVVLGILVAGFFLVRHDDRITTLELIGALLVFCWWPLYLVGIVVMRIFNGDWD